MPIASSSFPSSSWLVSPELHRCGLYANDYRMTSATRSYDDCSLHRPPSNSISLHKIIVFSGAVLLRHESMSTVRLRSSRLLTAYVLCHCYIVWWSTTVGCWIARLTCHSRHPWASLGSHHLSLWLLWLMLLLLLHHKIVLGVDSVLEHNWKVLVVLISDLANIVDLKRR